MSMTGVGTILRRGQGTDPIPAVGSDTFDVVGRVRNISGPDIKKSEVEDTTLDAPGGYTEALSGLRDGGEFTFPLSFTPGTEASPANNHQEVIADINSNTANSRRNWQIQWPDGTLADAQGEVFGVAFNTDPNSPVDVTITVRVNLGWTITYP